MIGLASQRKNLATLMDMEPYDISLGHNPLSDALYRGSDMVLNMQGLGRHSLSGALHRRPGVVISEQGSSHFSRWMRGARKLVDDSRVRLGSWNVGSLTGKLREIVDTMIRI